MRRVRSTNTAPELHVRRLIHGLGYRFRLHRADLPGKPDIVFPVRRKVIFVHGCFWHGHGCKAGRNRPRSNVEYWTPKLRRNQARDAHDIAALAQLGWNILVVWECALKREALLIADIHRFLGPKGTR